jgi:glycosyltransferase involved in cell wall biosynthesis
MTRPHVGMVLERSLGHLTHAETLSRLVPQNKTVTASIRQIEFGVTGRAARLPVFSSNWTVRAGIRARRAIRAMNGEARLDALFVHTQVPAVLVPDWVRRVPTIVSLDATPMQYDELGVEYDHHPGNRHVERLKWRLNRACLVGAERIVTWSRWAKAGVVDGYEIDSDKVTVLPPGVDASIWAPTAPRVVDEHGVRILFVGGDLQRKGGDVLLAAVRRLRAALVDGPSVQLDLVTRAEVAAEPGVTVHRHLTPNSPDLVALFHAADIFALPTRADCLGIALLEGGAAALPLVSTTIAGVPEIVRDGSTGMTVPPGDAEALAGVLRRLVEDRALRQRLGAGARALVAERFDANTNTARLVDMLADVARRAG